MKPVLQLQDLEALEKASAHLAERGHPSRVGPFDELPASEHAGWMSPDQGGYLLYLPDDDRFEQAMDCLGSFFGYVAGAGGDR